MNFKVKDIANKSGLSPATISRYLNNSGYVKKETKDLIKETIEKLKKENLLNSNNEIKNIAIIVPDINNEFFTDVIKGVNEYSNKNSYNVLIFDSNEDPVKEMNILESLNDLKVTGVILTPCILKNISLKDYIEKLEDINIPIVLLDRDIPFSNFDGVFINNIKGAFDATNTLITCGHKNIGIITGPLTSKPGKERLLGYEEAFKYNDKDINEEFIVEGNFTRESGYKLTKELLSKDNSVNALFVSNNMMTLGALNAINDLGLKINEDIALIGFDDMEVLNCLGLNISMVSRPTVEMGNLAAELLNLRLTNDEPRSVENITLNPFLILRGSEK